MPNFMQTGAAWLGEQLQTHAARSITIIQDQRDVLTVDGWCEKKEYTVPDIDGFVSSFVSYDWRFVTNDLPFMYAFDEGAILRETLSDLNSEDQIYEVVSIGKQGYSERFDTSGIMTTVHTKLVEVGEEVVAIYYPPGVANPITLEPVSLTNTENIEEYSADTGVIVKHERRVAAIDTNVMVVAGITKLQYGAQLEVADQRWHVDAQTSKWGNVMVNLGLIRKPLMRMREARGASI